MNPDVVQNLRYKLQKRVRRLNTVEYDTFYHQLRYFMNFIRQQPVICGILDELVTRFPDFKDEVNAKVEGNEFGEGMIVGETEEQYAAGAYYVFSRWSDTDDETLWLNEATGFEIDTDYNTRLAKIRHLFLEPLYDYIDEQLDDARAILALLIRYKHRCEWFRREQLNELCQKGGERKLAADMYEYLHDQGLVFHIEPHSASGIPDLISMQSDDDPLIADAKVFGPTDTHGKSYLIKGFNQVYTYTRDYNQPFGYMIVFRVCEKDLKFDVSGTNLSVPYTIHNGKTIFFVVIDIHSYETSASKRGQAKCITIVENELVREIQLEENTSDGITENGGGVVAEA